MLCEKIQPFPFFPLSTLSKYGLQSSWQKNLTMFSTIFNQDFPITLKNYCSLTNLKQFWVFAQSNALQKTQRIRQLILRGTRQHQQRLKFNRKHLFASVSWIATLYILSHDDGNKNAQQEKGIHHQEPLKQGDWHLDSENPRTTIHMSHEIPFYGCTVFTLIPRHLLFTTIHHSAPHEPWVCPICSKFTHISQYLKECSCKVMNKQLSGLPVFIGMLNISTFYCWRTIQASCWATELKKTPKAIDNIQLLHPTEEKVQQNKCSEQEYRL